jgi:hypothetical protein
VGEEATKAQSEKDTDKRRPGRSERTLLFGIKKRQKYPDCKPTY